MNKQSVPILYRVGYALIYLISMLPLWWHYFFCWIIYLLNYYIIGYRKKVVVDNIRNSFPEMSEDEVKTTVRKFYQGFSRHMAEILKLVSIKAANLERRFESNGLDLLDRLYDENRNVIICIGHVANWEMVNHLPRVIKQEPFAVYKPLSSKFSDYTMKRVRSRFGVNMLPSNSVARHMLKPHEKPAVYYMVADQRPPKSSVSEKHTFTFLNQRTSMFYGPEKLAVATDAAVAFVNLKEKKRGHYIGHVTLITEEPKKTEEGWITHEFARLLEENIHQAPHDWLWSHDRWRHNKQSAVNSKQ